MITESETVRRRTQSPRHHRSITLEPNPYGRGKVSFSLLGLIAALRESLPPELRQLPYSGTIDQWVTSDGILFWPDQLRRFRAFYEQSPV